MAELRFTKIGNGPPDSRVDERENLLASMCISSIGDREVGDAAIEGSNVSAVFEVVLCKVDGGAASGTLCG